jgi:dTDP-4-dehydrorhamnose reductase
LTVRWLITGSSGQLGTELVARLAADAPDDAVTALTRTDLDITDSAAVRAVVADVEPDVIVNAAAYTAVDAAETDEDRAYAVNAVGPAVLSAALSARGGRLIHVSTDYVFAGDATEPYAADAPTAPKSAYGRTKLAGELAVHELLPDTGYVVRTAWVYGGTGANFVKTMVRLEGSHDTVSVVDDQRGSPTWAADLAAGLVALARSDAPGGIYHCTNSGDTTWFGFTRAIFEELGSTDPERVRPTTSAAFVRPAPRPAYSVLSGEEWTAAGLAPLPVWRDALARAFAVDGDRLRGADG